jgi:hypothetical protein
LKQRTRRLAWFAALYVASFAVFALVTAALRLIGN